MLNYFSQASCQVFIIYIIVEGWMSFRELYVLDEPILLKTASKHCDENLKEGIWVGLIRVEYPHKQPKSDMLLMSLTSPLQSN